jgi:hypothetical protein
LQFGAEVTSSSIVSDAITVKSEPPPVKSLPFFQWSQEENQPSWRRDTSHDKQKLKVTEIYHSALPVLTVNFYGHMETHATTISIVATSGSTVKSPQDVSHVRVGITTECLEKSDGASTPECCILVTTEGVVVSNMSSN